MTEKSCADCGIEMERGFVPDLAHSTVTQTCWHRGEPESTTFLGMKTGVQVDRHGFVPLIAYRCPDCGFVKFYAHSSDDN